METLLISNKVYLVLRTRKLDAILVMSQIKVVITGNGFVLKTAENTIVKYTKTAERNVILQRARYKNLFASQSPLFGFASHEIVIVNEVFVSIL